MGCYEQSSCDSGDADLNSLGWINRDAITAFVSNILRKFNTVSTMGAHFIFPLGFRGGIAWVKVHGVLVSPGAFWPGEW